MPQVLFFFGKEVEGSVVVKWRHLQSRMKTVVKDGFTHRGEISGPIGYCLFILYGFRFNHVIERDSTGIPIRHNCLLGMTLLPYFPVPLSPLSSHKGVSSKNLTR